MDILMKSGDMCFNAVAIKASLLVWSHFLYRPQPKRISFCSGIDRPQKNSLTQFRQISRPIPTNQSPIQQITRPSNKRNISPSADTGRLYSWPTVPHVHLHGAYILSNSPFIPPPLDTPAKLACRVLDYLCKQPQGGGVDRCLLAERATCQGSTLISI